MFKPIKKFVKKNQTASLAFATIAVSLSIGLSVPSAITPSISEICFDWDPNCTTTRQTKAEAQKAAQKRTTLTPTTQNQPTIEDKLPEDEFNPPLTYNPPPSPSPSPPKSDGCREGERRCSPNGINQFCAPLPNSQGTEWISLSGSCDSSKPLSNYTSPTTNDSDNDDDNLTEDPINLPGSCLPEKMSGKQCPEGQVCTQVTDSLYMCQNPNQANAQPCSKPWSQAGPNTGSQELAYYSHSLTLNTEDECQVKAGVPTGWVVTKQVCKNGEWIDVEVEAPRNGVGTSNCPAIFNCDDYPDYCPEEENSQSDSQSEKQEVNQVSKFLNFVKNLFSFKI